MGTGFKHGAGGAGPLNFKVRGTVQAPENPGENTIWVHTEVSVSSYIFSAEEPAAPAEGAVWFAIGTSSTVRFNALKKNGIHVYPIAAKQYVGGAWMEVRAKSFQNGEWVDWWDGTIFGGGDPHEAITGGWIAVANAGVTCDIGSSIVFTVVGSVNRDASAYTVNRIDLSGYSAIVFSVNVTVKGLNFEVGITETNDVAYQTGWVARTSAAETGAQELEVPLTGIQGSYYIAAHADASSASVNTIRLVR